MKPCKKFYWIILLCLLVVDGTVVHGQGLSFADASKPYQDLQYDFNGHVKRDGSLYVPGKMGCSGYVSAVMQRMMYGEAWQKHAKYVHEVYQWRGGRIAAHFGLELAVLLTPEQVADPQVVQTLIASGVLQENRLYLFQLTRPARLLNGQWVTSGHTGFLRLRPNGSWIQSHFSGISSINGLASGNFILWYQGSIYRQAPVELYAIPEK